MMSRNLRAGLAVLAAIFPLLGVFLWGWNVREVVILYWFENLIIGLWQLAKMGLAGIGQKSAGCSLFFLMGFFTVHYGGFCAGHGVFILALTGGEGASGAPRALGSMGDWWGPFIFIGLLISVVRDAWASLPEAALWSVASMFAMRGLGVWQDFIQSGEWKNVEGNRLMLEPYQNVIILHVAIIIGGGLVMWRQDAWPLLGLIVLGKLGLDLRAIFKAPATTKEGNTR
ncbi:MAG: DUF6498-containing protein [Verrucomicrobiota bacterium JB023]|nr:DUF6498-containing protein [Verrucomicrobiota bacterium JB023]